MDLTLFFKTYRQRIQSFLEKSIFNRTPIAAELHDAMAYTILGGGKRLRPLLVYASGIAFSANEADLDLIAASIELIHIYSLIHDDLPALDNDNLRHGRPACHVQFKESTAIICGDTLQSLAFELLARPMATSDKQRQLEMIYTLAKASGDQGMAGGQILDMQAEQSQISVEQLENIHRLKTGALIACACELGALAGNASLEERACMNSFSTHLGLMFQIHDDVLDLTSSTDKLGKPQGSDIANQKSTYPALLGLPQAVELAWKHYHLALEALEQLNGRDTTILKELATFMIERDH